MSLPRAILPLAIAAAGRRMLGANASDAAQEFSGGVASVAALGKQWDVAPSAIALATRNPIRIVAHGFKAEPNPEKELIPLTLGDPTMHDLRPARKVTDAVMKAFASGKYHGYSEARGLKGAREAVATYYNCPEAPVTADDVTMALGTSQALDHVLTLLVNRGENVLVPKPGYIYSTACDNRGISSKAYRLLPEKDWKIDVEHLEAQVDDKTRAILINNPSNPCGSLVSREELEAVLDVAERHRLPVISDEVYEYMVFKGQTFYPLATLSKRVPVFTVSGLSKRFLCPGWRLGWIVTHNRNSILSATMRDSLIALTEVVLGPCCFLQAALPQILADPPTDLFNECIDLFEKNALHVMRILSDAPGLRPVMPRASMFMMIGIDCSSFADIRSDMEFAEKLLSEESVFCLPSVCFQYPGYVRIVVAPKESTMIEACNRIHSFSHRHSTKQSGNAVGYE